MSRRALGASGDLREGGAGLCFELAPTVPAFVVRHQGRVRAWINRCPHRGTRLDWEPGEFFEEAGSHLVCASHGAVFQPHDGLCIGGPCRGARLQAVPVIEEGGQIWLEPGHRVPSGAP